MFFDQSHFKFTLNQTGDTSRVLDRGFWEPIAVKSHHVSFLTLWKLPTEVHSKGTLVSALNRDTQRLFYVPYPTIIAMPRGQQKRKATGTSTTGQPPVHRRSTAATATYAARTTATTTRAEAEHGEREEPLTSAGRARWAVDQPANWSTAKLRSLIEEGRGLKLPSGMKKPQLLRMYLDNCHTGADADVPGTSAAAAELSDEAETTAAAYDSEPRPSHVTPTTRWGIAADLNGIATRARQRHQPTVSAADVTYVPVQDDADIRLRPRERRADSSRPLLRDVAAATSNSGEISEVEPLSDAVRNLQQAMFTLSRQMGDIVQSQRDSAAIAPQMMPPPSVPSTSSMLPQRPTVFTLTTAMERLEQSTGVSSRCAPTTALTDCPVGWRGFTSEDLPEVEVVPTAVRAAILDGKDVNLAMLLMPNFDLGEYSRYSESESDHAQFLRPLSSDPRLNRNLTLAEFITAFNKYRNIMCEIWDRRQELDAYEAMVVGIASRIEGTSFYEYHKAFSARAAALIVQHNVKIDWAVRDNGMFCSLFVGQTAKVCSLCGSVAHLSNFCPMLASGKPQAQSGNAYRGSVLGRPNQTHTSTDIQGRPRVSVGQREVCNNFNSDRGCPRKDCKFLHSCLKCRGPHASVVCPSTIGVPGRTRPPTAQ